MKIIRINEHYLPKLVTVFEEYRAFCDFEPSPQETMIFWLN